MSDDPDDIDWKGVDEEMARQILEMGQAYLHAQLQTAIAADQRATTMASIFASMALAVSAAFVALWDKSNNAAALLGGLVGAGFLLLAAGFGAYAARPTEFHVPGNHPSQWFAGRKGDLIRMIGGEAENTQRLIEKNDRIMARNQQAIRDGFALAVAAPIFAVLVWLLAR